MSNYIQHDKVNVTTYITCYNSRFCQSVSESDSRIWLRGDTQWVCIFLLRYSSTIPELLPCGVFLLVHVGSLCLVRVSFTCIYLLILPEILALLRVREESNFLSPKTASRLPSQGKNVTSSAIRTCHQCISRKPNTQESRIKHAYDGILFW